MQSSYPLPLLIPVLFGAEKQTPGIQQLVATDMKNTIRIPVAVLWIDISNNAPTESHNTKHK